ncbi:hypothetical protein KBC79_06935, partial [Candidatus Woesebacteria bacterium]|nr:hypothetical protein [Candidatus Woesebacteria bacterium]
MTSKTYLTSTIQCFSAYLPAFVWAATIFILSSQSQLPGFTIIGYDYMFKKLAHISVYAVLYLLLHR